MVENKSLIEWNSDLALAIHLNLCPWVVYEDRNEDLVS
jgi:hypothetical protein